MQPKFLEGRRLPSLDYLVIEGQERNKWSQINAKYKAYFAVEKAVANFLTTWLVQTNLKT